MSNDLYSRLGTCSRRAIQRRTRRGGKPYTYSPRGPLLERLSREMGLSIEGVYNALMQLRAELLGTDANRPK